jgi:peptide/nickel transport system permease protein
MIGYLIRRLLFAAALVFAVSSAALVVVELAPGDFAIEQLGPNASPQQVAELRARLGLDRPLGVQYLDWLSRAVRFDFGRSLANGRPVAELVSEGASNTALLASSALLLSTLVGIPLGVLTGARRSGPLRGTVRAASMFLVSMPPLLTSLFLVFFAARTGWFPIGGMGSAGGGLADRAQHLVVPVLALALPLLATFERLQAQATSEVMAQPFVLATLARGVPRSRILRRDALKPALLPIASIYGLVVGSLLSGSFAVEVVTTWPGLGSLMLNALRARDVYLVAGCAAAGAVFLAAGTLLSDAALALIDPRTTE